MGNRRFVQCAVIAMLMVALLIGAPVSATAGPHRASAAVTAGQAAAQLDCRPLAQRQPPVTTPAPTPAPAGPPAANLTKVTIGYIPVSIYAPLFVAQDLGYYREFGLDVTLQSSAGGSDVITQTASGATDIAAAGAGPAFWNAAAQDLPITVIAPGHQEGSPVATPLMISRQACESGSIASVADLRGKRVAVNAPGGTEFWLGAALATAGLTIDDVNERFLAFPDAIAALQSGAIDAAMIGEPLATSAEQDGIAVRLLSDFPVQGIQATAMIANDDFLARHPDAATGFVAAYLKATRSLSNGGFHDPTILAILQKYTSVPPELSQQAVAPIYQVNGEVNLASLGQLQQFFRGRGQLEYDQDIDPTTLVDPQYVNAALALIGPTPTVAPDIATPGIGTPPATPLTRVG